MLCASVLHAIPYFSDHKAYLKSFNFVKNRKCASPWDAPNVWIWLCFLR